MLWGDDRSLPRRRRGSATLFCGFAIDLGGRKAGIAISTSYAVSCFGGGIGIVENGVSGYLLRLFHRFPGRTGVA